MSRSAVLIPAFLALLMACSDAPEAGQPEDYGALLSNLTTESVARLQKVRVGRDLGKELQTCLPSEIDFAPDIYTAIERAVAADRPILMTSVVTKGGKKQSGCDV